MHMALWIAQSILAAAMLGAGLMKLMKTKGLRPVKWCTMTR